ncbi:DciA family protein [Streptomyces sp. NBC_01221]|uniref:DciA family protein n=1 Tax=Streptomyces sp. NBC_01221 TaxID=2903782 RepID=UPI0022547602|nr:DciA family protein [Streptomyces sp. NBC_01221]MCX4792454.1 DciA family protein [Streptomyces sp. NBC_01221]
MTEQPTASGADLARQALAAYKSTARPSTQPKPRTRARRVDRGSGRDPVGLGALLGRVSAEQGWEASLSAGSITDRWPELCPQYVGRIEPVHYDPERRVLDLRPCSPAYAAQLRLLGGQLAKQINDKVGSEVVRAIRPLPVGQISATPADRPAIAPQPPTAAPVKTWDTASPGYQAALSAIRPTTPSTVDARVVEAMQRQAHAMLREPETAFTDAIVARQELEEAAATENPDPLLASIQAATAYKHRGADQPVRRAFDVA